MNEQPQQTPGDAEAEDPNEASLVSIGEIAKHHTITTRTIRFYETKGLITPKRIGNARAYDRRDRARLTLILRGKRLGFTLEEISEYLDLYDSDPTQVTQWQHLLDKLEIAAGDLKQKRADIEETLKELDAMREICMKELDKPRHGQDKTNE